MSEKSSQVSNIKMWWKSRALQSDDADARIRAIQKLVTTKDARAVSAAAEMLSDADVDVRVAAAEALGEMGDVRAVESLTTLAVHEEDPGVCGAIASSLRLLDPAAASQALLRSLDNEDASVRQNAASTLRRVGWEQLDPPDRARVAILQHNWEEVAIFGKDALEPLAAAVSNGTQHAKREAAQVIGEIGSPKACDILLALLSDADLDVAGHEVAAWGLKRYFWERLTASQCATVAIIEGDWTQVADFKEEAVEPIRAAMADRDVTLCKQATEALAKIGGTVAAQALADVLSDHAHDVSVRESAATALARLGDESHIPTLIHAMQDEGWVVREAAASALHSMNWTPENETDRAFWVVANQYWEEAVTLGETAIEPLIRALPYRSVCRPASQALLKIGTAGLEALIEMLRDHTQSMSVREVLATTLAETGDERAIAPIEAMLNENDMVVRQVAVWTLTKLGWEPQNDKQRALVAIANEEWDDLAELGGAAVEPLLMLARDSLALEETTRVLYEILGSSPQKITIAQLRGIAALGGDATMGRRKGDAGDGDAANAPTGQQVTSKRLNEMARYELYRRGIMF